MDWLSKQASEHPEQKVYSELQSLYQAKLWFQLSKALVGAVQEESLQSGKALLDLYTNVVKKLPEYTKKLVPLHVAQIIVAASYQCPADVRAGFIEGAGKDLEGHAEAEVMLFMARSRQVLATGKREAAAELLVKGKEKLDEYTGIMAPLVQCEYFRASYELAKAKGETAQYFENAMLFLTYNGLERLTKEEQVALAVDVGTAALLGKGIYTFGELLQHPILKVLEGTPHAWLAAMLSAFNKGDLAAFRTVHSQQAQVKELKENYGLMLEKAQIMAMIDLAFSRPTGDRTFDFKEICQRCEVKETEVDFLLIKAFSQGVMKGKIDGVERRVQITYLKPRVLDKEQLQVMKKGLKTWASTVHETALFLEANSPELMPMQLS